MNTADVRGMDQKKISGVFGEIEKRYDGITARRCTIITSSYNI
jgi:hypothetical protein